MRIALKQFQEDAVAKLVRHMRGAVRDARQGDLQSVCLSSTTGSGKTVMLTAAIEQLLLGDDDNSPQQNASFLWITDMPELNEQTRRKMVDAGSVFGSENLRIVDAAFDQETFSPGTVSFLNIQKIGKDKGLVTRGDKRAYTIWETISNTVAVSGDRPFFVIIDEAHRGMTEAADQADAATIIQKFIKGASGEIPPAPVVVGISATPERFNNLILGTGRMNRPIEVDVAEVRASGLIKDTLILHHPRREQPADMTMLRHAAQRLKTMAAHWAAYCAKHEPATLVPLLVVQVEDARTKGSFSDTDIRQAINVLRDELGNLPGDAFAHSFQEGSTLEIEGEQLRYIPPSDIQADPDVRVIFFKTSLNTGWDCPRAEVIMSFRAAAEATFIAQLVGRMVRTPLARRIVDDEVLNTVSLYLPHYDKRGLDRIVSKLSKPDDGAMPLDVIADDASVELVPTRGSEHALAALAGLPSYVVPRMRKANQVRRLMKFARLLANDDVDEAAPAYAKDAMLDVLNKAYEERRGTDEFRRVVVERGTIEIAATNWDVGTAQIREGGSISLDVSAENIEDLFDAAGRKINEGLHKSWWRARVAGKPADRELAKLELFALAIDPDIIRRLERAAQELVQAWLSKHHAAIASLDEGSRAQYTEIRNLTSQPEITSLSYPAVIQSQAGDAEWKKHIYVSAEGSFSATFNSVEVDVLQREISRPEMSYWLRNLPRKSWSICIPYEVDGEFRSMYPDFLFVRSVNGGLVVDLIEPHSISLADAPAKAAGLAKYAAQHADRFGRIELIMVDGRAARSFDLTNEVVRNQLRAVRLPDQLRALMAAAA